MKAWSLLLMLALPTWSLANPDIQFRCTHEDGQVSVQDRPCAKGERQVIQRRGASSEPILVTQGVDDNVRAAPEAPQVLDSNAPGQARGEAEEKGNTTILDSSVIRRQREAAEASAARAAEGPRAPLPSIFRCTRPDGGQYFNEREPAPARCVMMGIEGLGGIAPVNAASCEVQRDSCEEMGEEQRCGAWQQRFRDARGHERFATEQTAVATRLERERLQALLESSDCPVPQ